MSLKNDMEKKKEKEMNWKNLIFHSDIKELNLKIL